MGAKYLEIFEKNGIGTVLDLLLRWPVHYLDFSNPRQRIDVEEKRIYRLEIEAFRLRRIHKKRLSILTIDARLAGTKIEVTLFNKPYLFDSLKGKREIYIYGKLEKKNGTIRATSPMVFTDAVGQRVLPIYAEIAAIKSGTIRKIIENIFAELSDDHESLPQAVVERYRFKGIVESLRRIHLPKTAAPEAIDRLKSRFVYGEFLFFQLELQYVRNRFKMVRRIHSYTIDAAARRAIDESLEFALTPDQVTAFEDIVNDLKGECAMQRLLQGDVGSGKTVVAFLALLLAKQGGLQGALLAPTEILANQHFENGKTFFKDASIALLTGSTSHKSRQDIVRRLEEGKIDIIFGTHALLHENLRFKNLSLVVIDEQHRFGVSQRAALYYKGRSVDVLVTTATPIPRTMLLSLYNDLSVSTIKSKPAGRLPIQTKIIDAARRDEFYRWLKDKIQAGNKAYIILPLIEESQFFSELKSIEAEADYFKEIFAGVPLGIVSGRTGSDQKEQVLNDFASGAVRVLVSTTVIEVGIDVPDATIMVIEDADRYGLSQLHQLRGRVGRGALQSYCYLLPSANIGDSGRQRLETIAATEDGFAIAETDLQMRGGGLISGQEQSGRLDFKIGDIKRDYKIFKAAQRDAAAILKDPSQQTEPIKALLKTLDQKITTLHFS